MMKKILTTSLVVAALAFSGCGDSDGEDNLKMQQGLDKGNTSGTINSLGSKSIDSLNDGEKMMLASAYMSKAGLSLTDTLKLVTTSSADGDDSTDDGGFSNFAQEIAKIKEDNPNALADLDNAVKYYDSISNQNDVASKSISRGDTEDELAKLGERDLFLALAYLTKSTIVMSYLGDISKVDEDDVADHPNLVASGCAMAKIFDKDNIPAECTANGGTVVLSKEDGKNDRNVTVELFNSTGKIGTYTRYVDANASDMYLTNYEDTELKKILGSDGKTPFTIKTVLLKTFNDAFKLIKRVAPDDAKDDVDEFKREILGCEDNPTNCPDLNNYLTMSDLSKFIANQD